MNRHVRNTGAALAFVGALLTLCCSPASTERPAPAGGTTSASPSSAATLPWQCAPQPASPVRSQPLAATDLGAVWDALGQLAQMPVPPDRDVLTPGPNSITVWPFESVYLLGGAGGEARIFVPRPVNALTAEQRAEVLDLVNYLETLRPRPAHFRVSGYRLKSVDAKPSIELLGDDCQLTPGAALVARRDESAVAMLAERLSEIGELTGAYIDPQGELVLLGQPRRADSPPALTLDDMARAYRAEFHRCDCPQSIEGHRCDGAFVSIDPDNKDPYGPAHIVLAPCIRDSHMGNVFVLADILLKELASGFHHATGDPLPVPTGHRTQSSFGVGDPAATWTRYWLYADPHSQDAFLQLSKDRSFVGTGRFHLSLGVETTGPKDEVISTDEPDSKGKRLEGLPAHAFARQINRAWRERYQPFFPVLRELDNQTRLIQIMSWLHNNHPNAQREALFARLPLHFEPTDRRIALRAAATVALETQGEQVHSVPFLHYGGVVNQGLFAESAAAQVATRALPATRAVLPAAESTAVRAVSAAKGPVKGLVEKQFASPGVFPRAVVTVENPTVVKSAAGELHSVVKLPVGVVDKQVAVLEKPMVMGHRAAEVRASAMMSRLGGEGANLSTGPPALVKNAQGALMSTVEVRPAAMSAARQLGGETLAASRQVTQFVYGSAGKLPSTVSGPVGETAAIVQEVETLTVISRETVLASRTLQVGEGVGGIIAGGDSALREARPIDDAALAERGRAFGLHVPNVSTPLPEPVYLDAQEAKSGAGRPTPLVRVRCDEGAHILHVGHLDVPFADLASFEHKLRSDAETRSRWLAIQPAGTQPIVMGRAAPLWQSVGLARALHTMRPDKPALVIMRENETLDASHSRLSHPPIRHLGDGRVQPLLLPLYAFFSTGAAWRQVSSAAEVPPGVGVVAVHGEDANLERTIARLALLGRLKDKTLVVALPRENSTLGATLLILLEAGELDSVLVSRDGASAARLTSAIASTVRKGAPLLSALGSDSDAAPVLIVRGP